LQIKSILNQANLPKEEIAMVKLNCVLLALAVMLTSAISASRMETASFGEAEEYVCPPCGCSEDGKVFHEAGVCSACSMNLVLKGSPASAPMNTGSRAARQRVAILIFDGVQIIDYTGPYEVFGQAGFEVVTVAAKPDMIQTSMGMKVTPHFTLENAPKADVIVVPGGNVQPTQEDAQVIKWIQDSAKDAQHVLSVCNGAYILAKTGLLDGLTATTFYDLLDGLQAAAPKTKVVRDQRYVDNGKIITTAGISSGIDGSLYVVSKLRSKAVAQMAALNMEYDYKPDSSYARGNFADRHLRQIFTRGLRLPVPNGATARVQSTEGDAAKWQVRWQVDGATTSEAVLQSLNDTLTHFSQWQPQPKQAKANQSRWQFTDEAGGLWQAEVSSEPLPNEKTKFVATIKIANTGKRAAVNPGTGTATREDALIVTDAWVAEPPPGRNLTAAYLVIENNGQAETMLTAAVANVAGVTELHQMISEGNFMQMRRVPHLKLPARSRTELTGTFHLMLINLSGEVKEGDQVTLTLEFANAVKKTLTVPVRKRTREER
jgi:copper(I)-binding protein/putative intracellular protease/amidase